ncbi:phosphatase PAP2 family protein [Tenacibaculum sp. SG-28]|uniref:phosphatase PAP2 family protein n=1 Tax=Tenacibaculum sp. SG-28 TaxID=754426 RepID=UPI000CF475C0|nr:phosphatase PAP2 family protein [Tenacibaculum sp. SG-28]PQJ19665.1 hypothetical protein BSU00_11835 [Tenacibaculum sp. SG-28]
MESLFELDTELLLFLNSLGSPRFDSFWLAITKQFNWAPVFLLVLVYMFRQLGVKKGVFTLVFLIFLVAFSDQFTNFIKGITSRTRPCNTDALQDHLRYFSYKPKGYSFWSGHASLSTTFTVFMILMFRTRSKSIYALLVFPLFFGYSRIYLGVHYPLDVTMGYISGIILGWLFFRLYRILHQKIFKQPYF